MKLQRENNQSSEYKSLRGKSVFRIVGTEEQADLIRRLDDAIGSEVHNDSFILQDGSRRVRTWKQECCDAFALMGHFKRLAVRQGWTTEEWQTVTNKCMEGDYDTLIQTLMAHMEEE